MSDIRRRAVTGIRQGDTFSVTRTFSAEDVENFASISKDYNPIHFEQRFAETKNFRGLICHGLLVASLVTEIGGQIGWLASGMTLQFKRPVFIGETIRCDLVIDSIDDSGRAAASALFTNSTGATVLTGSLSGMVPGEPEKKVLQAMMAEGDPTNKI